MNSTPQSIYCSGTVDVVHNPKVLLQTWVDVAVWTNFKKVVTTLVILFQTVVSLTALMCWSLMSWAEMALAQIIVNITQQIPFSALHPYNGRSLRENKEL